MSLDRRSELSRNLELELAGCLPRRSVQRSGSEELCNWFSERASHNVAHTVLCLLPNEPRQDGQGPYTHRRSSDAAADQHLPRGGLLRATWSALRVLLCEWDNAGWCVPN